MNNCYCCNSPRKSFIKNKSTLLSNHKNFKIINIENIKDKYLCLNCIHNIFGFVLKIDTLFFRHRFDIGKHPGDICNDQFEKMQSLNVSDIIKFSLDFINYNNASDPRDLYDELILCDNCHVKTDIKLLNNVIEPRNEYNHYVKDENLKFCKKCIDIIENKIIDRKNNLSQILLTKNKNNISYNNFELCINHKQFVDESYSTTYFGIFQENLCLFDLDLKHILNIVKYIKKNKFNFNTLFKIQKETNLKQKLKYNDYDINIIEDKNKLYKNKLYYLEFELYTQGVKCKVIRNNTNEIIIKKKSFNIKDLQNMYNDIK